MYTLRMIWPFRVLVISVAVLWALVPQLACFMSDPTTPAEMECCKEMMNDCSGMNMSQECCRTPAPPEVGIIAKATRVNQPHMAEAVMLNVESYLLLTPIRRPAIQDTHAPPHQADASPLVLRI